MTMKMKMKMSSYVIIVMLSFIFEASDAQTIGHNPKRTVNITNDLGPGIPLTVECKSGDDDLGKRDINYKEEYNWEFKSNAVLQNTLFYCYMWWQNVYGSFDVYKATRDDSRCFTCLWNVTTFGAFSFDQGTKSWDLMYIWQPPSN